MYLIHNVLNTHVLYIISVWMWFFFWVSLFHLMCYSSSKCCPHHLSLCRPSYCNSHYCISKFVSGFQSDSSYCILNHISSFLLFILMHSVIFFLLFSLKRRKSCSQSADVMQQQETGEWSCVKSVSETKQDAQEDERIEVGDDAS